MTIMAVPSCETISAKNLFNVSQIEIFWQQAGDYLAVKVDRTTKNKKVRFGSPESAPDDPLIPRELFQFTEIRLIPVPVPLIQNR